MSVHSHIVSDYKKIMPSQESTEVQDLKKSCIDIFICTLHYILGLSIVTKRVWDSNLQRQGKTYSIVFLLYYKLFEKILSNFSNQAQI